MAAGSRQRGRGLTVCEARYRAAKNEASRAQISCEPNAAGHACTKSVVTSGNGLHHRRMSKTECDAARFCTSRAATAAQTTACKAYTVDPVRAMPDK